MAAAARVSCGLGRCNAETVERLERVLKRAGLPTAMPAEITAEALAGAMQHDKKSAGGRIRFVVLQEIGRTAFVELSRFDIVKYL
jgi:3-dehydroquinate synthase